MRAGDERLRLAWAFRIAPVGGFWTEVVAWGPDARARAARARRDARRRLYPCGRLRPVIRRLPAPQDGCGRPVRLRLAWRFDDGEWTHLKYGRGALARARAARGELRGLLVPCGPILPVLAWLPDYDEGAP